MNPGASYKELFQSIGMAALQLAMAGDHKKAAKELRRSIDSSFYIDPTSAQCYLAKRDEIEKQLKLLDAAAIFLNTVTETLGPQHPDVLLIQAARHQS